MPGGYGTEDTDWGSAGTTAPSGAYSGPHDIDEGPNTVADAVNAFQSAPPQLSFTPDLQNQAQSAIAAQTPLPTGYEDVFDPFDLDQDMATGFGSVFGASSGSTGSSQTVQDALTFMIDQEVQNIISNQTNGNPNTFYNPTSSDINTAINAAYANFYPEIDQMTLEEFVAGGGTEADYTASMAAMKPGYANLMGYDPTEAGHTTMGDQYYNNWLNSQNYGGDSGNAWDDWYGGGQYGTTGSLSDLARQTWFSESLADVERREQERMDEGLGVATMADMEQMYDKEFAAQANPLYDPGFSLAATQEFDPGDIYGDLRLWQEAQKA